MTNEQQFLFYFFVVGTDRSCILNIICLFVLFKVMSYV